METFDHKMSKSDPRGAILLHDDQAVMRKKMRRPTLTLLTSIRRCTNSPTHRASRARRDPRHAQSEVWRTLNLG